MIQHSVFLEGAISLRDMKYYFIYRQRKAAVICYIYIFLLSALVYSVYGFPFTVYNNETLELIYNCNLQSPADFDTSTFFQIRK